MEAKSLISEKENYVSQLTEKRISMAQLEPIVDAKRAKYEKLKTDYETIVPKEGANIADELIANLSSMYAKRDELSTSLKMRKDERMKLSAEIDRKDQQVRQIRRQLDETRNNVAQANTNKAVLETKLENDFWKHMLEVLVVLSLSLLAFYFSFDYKWLLPILCYIAYKSDKLEVILASYAILIFVYPYTVSGFAPKLYTNSYGVAAIPLIM